MEMSDLGMKELIIQYGQETCTIILIEGADSPSLVHAVASRFSLGHTRFHLQFPDKDSIVPLTSALPGGLTLRLHVNELSAATSLPSVSVSIPEIGLPPQGPGSRSSLAVPLLANTFPPADGTAASPMVQLQHVRRRTISGRAHRQSHLHGERPSIFNRNRNMSGASGADATPAIPGDEVDDAEMERQHSQASYIEDEAIEALHDVQEAQASIERFSRMATDLANERTLLAWMRTMMACIRTAFAYLSVTASGWWLGSVSASRLAMVTAVLVATVTGIIRYNRVKDITFQPTPPQHFGRLSIRYFYWTLAVSMIAMVCGMWANAWHKG